MSYLQSFIVGAIGWQLCIIYSATFSLLEFNVYLTQKKNYQNNFPAKPQCSEETTVRGSPSFSLFTLSLTGASFIFFPPP